MLGNADDVVAETDDEETLEGSSEKKNDLISDSEQLSMLAAL